MRRDSFSRILSRGERCYVRYVSLKGVCTIYERGCEAVDESDWEKLRGAPRREERLLCVHPACQCHSTLSLETSLIRRKSKTSIAGEFRY